MSEDDVRRFIGDPHGTVCTNGILLGKPYPRAYGAFPRVFGHYVREGVLRLEEAGAGDSRGLKVQERVRKGDIVYKAE